MNKNRKLFTILLLSLLTFSAFSILLTANAAQISIPTFAYLSVTPNPVGLNQAAYVNFWIDKVPPTAFDKYGDRWQNFTLKVSKPDGTTQILGPYKSDAVGGSATTFTPIAIGTYTFVFSFLGQTITGENPDPISGTLNPASIGNYYQPSTSDPVTLTVQQQQIPGVYPENPLPTGYWGRPIFAMNTNWYSIAGNWLGLGITSFANTGQYNAISNYNPYTTAPSTAHIIWTNPLAFGGIMGGEFGGSEVNSNFMSTDQYEPKFAPIIMNGVLYYELYTGAYSNPAGFTAINLRTGQTLWTNKNNTEILRCGQIYDYTSPNQYGGIAYLWAQNSYGVAGQQGSPSFGNVYSLFDAMTGNWVLDIVNGTGVKFVEASDGSLLGYYVNSTSLTLNMWNSSQCITNYGLASRQNTNVWLWRPPQGAKIDWGYGVEWSVPLATNISGNAISPNLGVGLVTSDVVLMSSTPSVGGASSATAFQPGYVYRAGYSATTGQLLWGPINQTEVPWTRISGLLYGIGPAGNGLYMEYTSETQSWIAYSLTTGAKLWGPVKGPIDNPWGYYNVHADIAYGSLYAVDLGGHVNAFNLTNGALEWTFETGSSGYETPYGVWPVLHLDVIGDGKLYVMGGHTYSPPLFHGAKLYCINASTGKEIWSIFDFTDSNGPAAALADGYLVEPNAYDNQIYTYGKGQSATSVTYSSVIGSSNSVLIKGTVTDQSPGQTSLGIPAAGTPAISDNSMSAWMEYLYQQQPKPTNATGVSIHLTAIDPNGNLQDIARVTSDIDGNYAFVWTPPVPGVYSVKATFEGSNSYFSSYGTATFALAQAPAASVISSPQPTATSPQSTSSPIQTVSPSPSQAPQPTSGMPTMTYVAIAAAIVIIAVIATAVVLRRRK